VKRKMGVKFVSVKATSPQIRRTRVPNLRRLIIYKESTKKRYKTQTKMQIQRTQTNNKTVFTPDRLTNELFLHTSTQCVHLSETFRTSYSLFSIVVIRQTTSTEHTISVFFLIFFCRIVSESNC